ncbi:hypothetical protein ONE63_011269 [Megalurothrips usitatus]|uniref:Uncharacterized protein n=1 Tax=Megalurothrips usitatus TaxID=439358 RepID=A0AAV7X0G1_9NEOP|nr:hypothetical protein ONE63_011269 [Megalurothrips usitatus]
MAAEKSIDELLNEVQEVDCKIPFGQLKLNVPYVVRSVERSSAIIGGRTVLGVLARILSPEGMALFTYLPSSFKKLDDRVLQKVNSDFLAGQSWSVVNYGMIGSAGIGKLHKPGEGRLMVSVVYKMVC